MLLFSLLYLFLDFLFGFTLRSYRRGARPISGDSRLSGLEEICRQTAEAFRAKGIRFMIKESEEINAWAISSFRRKYVIITTGLLVHFDQTYEEEKAIGAARASIGHEARLMRNFRKWCGGISGGLKSIFPDGYMHCMPQC